MIGNSLINELKKIYNNNQSNYSNYAFCLYLFIHRLYENISKNNIERVYFFSREGEFLKQLFDVYCASQCKKIESRYLYVSRQSTYVASLKNIEDERFRSLFFRYPDMSINTFLSNIGFSEISISNINNSIEIDCNEMIMNFSKSEQFKILIGNIAFVREYEETVKRSKDILICYLTQEDFFNNDEVAIVDIGWKGSIQDNIYNAIKGSIKIYGYYYGLDGDVETSVMNQKNGIVFSSYPFYSRLYNIWSFDSHFLERLCSASHASTKGYSICQQSKKIVPVFNPFGREEKSYALVKPIQKCIVGKFSEISELIKNSTIDEFELEKLFVDFHINCVCKVACSDMKVQNELLRCQNENFGFLDSNANRLKNIFSFRNIVKVGIEKYYLLKSPLLICSILNYKKIYFISVLIMRHQLKSLRKLL